MLDNLFDYIATNGLMEALSVGVIPSVLLVSVLILTLKLVEMNRTMDSRIVQAALKRQKEGLAALREFKLQSAKEDLAKEDSGVATGKVNHLRKRVERLKAEKEKLNNRYKG